MHADAVVHEDGQSQSILIRGVLFWKNAVYTFPFVSFCDYFGTQSLQSSSLSCFVPVACCCTTAAGLLVLSYDIPAHPR